MTNWKTFREEILDITNELVQEHNYIYEEALFSAIRKVYAREMNINLKKELIYIPSTIDWLTQEATICKYCKNNICELRTIDRECFGTEDLMECCGMLTQQEAESDHIGEVNEMVEPQRSKARFIKTIGGKLLNTSQIVDIVKSEINETQTVVIDVNNDVRFIQKPINEVIQQLGIEVI